MKNFTKKQKLSLLVVSVLVAALLSIFLVLKLTHKKNVESLDNGKPTQVEVVNLNDVQEIDDALNAQIKEKGQNANSLDNYVGHIFFPSLPNISEPMIQGTDNAFYVDHDPQGNYSIYGSVFLDFENKRDFSDALTIIYGHSVFFNGKPNDDTLFTAFRHYADKDFMKKNQVFYIKTKDNSVLKGEVFAYNFISSLENHTDTYYLIDYPEARTEEEFAKFLQEKSRVYDDSIEIKNGDKMIIFSTCYDYSQPERHIVYAKLTKVG